MCCSGTIKYFIFYHTCQNKTLRYMENLHRNLFDDAKWQMIYKIAYLKYFVIIKTYILAISILNFW